MEGRERSLTVNGAAAKRQRRPERSLERSAIWQPVQRRQLYEYELPLNTVNGRIIEMLFDILPGSEKILSAGCAELMIPCQTSERGAHSEPSRERNRQHPEMRMGIERKP